MAIVFGYNTALRWYRDLSRHEQLYYAQQSPSRPMKCSLDKAQFRVFDPRSAGIMSRKLHVCIGNSHERSKVSRVVNHVCKIELPRASLVSLGGGVYMPTPELLFLQYAQLLDFLQLLLLGLELCGDYSISPNGELINRLPLTTPKKIQGYLERATGINGVKLARAVAKYLTAHSRSPLESETFALLCLPYRFGGFGLPAAELNGKVTLVGMTTGRSYVRTCDLLWRDAGVAVEYDSDLIHTGGEKIASDAQRRVELAKVGITVITVTSRQLHSFSQMDEVAQTIANMLGVRLRPSEKSRGAQRKLHHEMMSDAGYPVVW